MSLPNRVRELRELHRLSQRELGRRMGGLSGPEVHKLETGYRRMTAAHLDKLTGVFGCSQEEIMGRPRPEARPETVEHEMLAALLRIERLLERMVAGRRDEAA